jgi:hypothetical protein
MPFVGRDRYLMTEDSNQAALAVGFDPRNAEPTIFAIEDNGLDQSG